jgi:hypothetical protein
MPDDRESLTTAGEAENAPADIDPARMITEQRSAAGTGRVEARRSAETAARELLDQHAGRMTAEQVLELGRLVSTDLVRGQEKHGRFAPAFVGATIQRIAERVDEFNPWAARLWGRNEEDALAAVDQLLTNPSALFGAGRSLPSLFMYLRDPERFAVWVDGTERGLRALTDYAGEKRQGGVEAYRRFCAAAHRFRERYEVAPEELDAVLANAASIAASRAREAAHQPAVSITRDAFDFLRDLQSNNSTSWMEANRARYQQALRDPFRALMEAVAARFIRDLDPEIKAEVKSGQVMASIKKRFSDEEGDYYPYYWGAFSRGRKQSDVQLFVNIHPDRLGFGLTFGSASTEALESLRGRLPDRAAVAWDALSPVRDRIRFYSNYKEGTIVEATEPADLVAWAAGSDPEIVEELAPDDPLIGSLELVERVGVLLSALHPLAAAAWGAEIAGEDVVTEPQDEPEPYTLEHLAADTLLPIDTLEEWISLLHGTKKQAIFYGPPGTSKTFVATRLAEFLAGTLERVLTIQFHPSFSYEDFIEGLRPEAGDSGDASAGIRYEIRPGLFQEFCDRARAHLAETYVCVIDEINRADLGSVLGELMYLLEYRGSSIQLPYSKRRFSVPSNVIVVATMNTADRSLALVDFALRRRFHALPLLPDRDLLSKFLEGNATDASLAMRFFELVQDRVGRTDFAPGHSYWMLEDPSAAALSQVWRYELRPYLEEFWFENPSRLEELARDVEQLLAEEA